MNRYAAILKKTRELVEKARAQGFAFGYVVDGGRKIKIVAEPRNALGGISVRVLDSVGKEDSDMK